MLASKDVTALADLRATLGATGRTALREKIRQYRGLLAKRGDKVNAANAAQTRQSPDPLDVTAKMANREFRENAGHRGR
jgi:hypothetical protein